MTTQSFNLLDYVKELATKDDIRKLETKLENKIVVFEKNMTIKLGTITAVVGALIVVSLNIL